MARSVLALALAGSLLGLAAAARAARPRSHEVAGAAAAEVVVLRPVRQIRPRRSCSAASRSISEVCSVCHGLKLRGVPQPRPALGYSDGAGQSDRGRIQDPGRPERSGRDVRARRPAGRPFPDAVAERERRARALQRRAAGHVGARQGAQLRARLPVVHLRHASPSSRSTASTTSTRC